mmetsp:Transcript_29092/g.39538  ORF Transcript_29092/g.39538 Transcript_29092/m.39538 type:complete len:91 (-) Transcript_29092:1412-1684(-)
MKTMTTYETQWRQVSLIDDDSRKGVRMLHALASHSGDNVIQRHASHPWQAQHAKPSLAGSARFVLHFDDDVRLLDRGCTTRLSKVFPREL